MTPADLEPAGGTEAPGRRKRLRPAGGYHTTASFQAATLIYDAT